MRLLLLAALVIAPVAASAQSTGEIFRSTITRNGHSCPTVTDAQAIGTIEGGDAAVAVACSNGERHVVRIHGDNSVTYISSCGIFESQTSGECFARQ